MYHLRRHLRSPVCQLYGTLQEISSVIADTVGMGRSNHAARLLTACFAAGVLSAAPARAADVVGHLRSPGVVWIDDGSRLQPVSATMRNVEKSFIPEIVIVPVGSSITFPNDDPFFHNIYSTGGADTFDLGFYDMGPGKTEVLSKAGVLDVGCHIHKQMHAVIVVVDGPYTQTDDFAFKLDDVRPGRHELHAWSVGYGERTLSVVIPASGTLSVRPEI
jgi:plastocyanin